MKRRDAILLISTFSAIVAGYHIFKKKEVYLEPDFEFLDNNKNLIALIVDIIIPETESVGAIQAGVQDYIINLVKYSLPINEVNVIMNGISEIRDTAVNMYGKEFEKCLEEDKRSMIISVLEEFNLNRGIIGKVKHKYWGKSFFELIKELTVEGYCTSKEGATDALVYLPVPGIYIGCIKMDIDQNVWAL